MVLFNLLVCDEKNDEEVLPIIPSAQKAVYVSELFLGNLYHKSVT